MRPADYIANQRETNFRHSNGHIEGPTEEAITYAAYLNQTAAELGQPTGSVLDVGCRSGMALPTLAKGFTRVVGCDIVPEFIALANRYGDAVEADMHELPFKDGEFDWIFCTGTIEHAYDVQRVMAEFCRVARHGIFVIADMQDEAHFKANDSHYTQLETPEDWLTTLSWPGWNLVSLEAINNHALQLVWLKAPAFWHLRRGLDWHTSRIKA